MKGRNEGGGGERVMAEDPAGGMESLQISCMRERPPSRPRIYRENSLSPRVGEFISIERIGIYSTGSI